MSEMMAFSFAPHAVANSQGFIRQTEERPAAPQPIATSALGSQSSLVQPSHVTCAAALAVGLSTAVVGKGRRRRNRACSKRGSTTRVARAESQQQTALVDYDSESVLELAKKANVKLEVKPWEFLSGIAKDASRGWFVKRAEERGIKWTELVQEEEASQEHLNRLYEEVNNPNLEYPDYYTKPFHGYDEGNLNWKAAHELVPATQSMCLSYYDGLSWEEAQEKFRANARNTFQTEWQKRHGDAQPQNLLDMGCSCGFSTAEMAKVFPGAKATGLDLSPYFLATAKRQYPEIDFVHRLAEETNFDAESYDAITINFLLHEVPLETSKRIIAECERLLKPGGMLAILDVDPRRLLELPPMRRWAFQVTEPWCKDGEYYSLKLSEELGKVGFEGITTAKNDPVNAIAVAFKPADA
mmetsp:Transcript_70616/g.132140  ORF Transcript_70616/g.132140 Transcript_70616/m.132140 type:complete len:412 (+) Transcript_70616:61-1296(+)